MQVIDPDSAAHYRLALQYLRTETEGPLFEHMKAKLAGIASHTGMSKIFRLQGSDVYRVRGIECVDGESAPRPGPTAGRLAALRACTHALGNCTDLAALLDESLACLAAHFGIDHSMLLMFDEKTERLYTVASRGYAESGVGSELRLGEGIIGVAARERTAIRIGHMAREYLYSRAMREGFAAGAPAGDLETEIPLPGLPESRSQLAVPVVHGRCLLGVLYGESPQDLRFSYEDEDALLTFADHLAMAMHILGQSAETHEPPATTAPDAVRVSGTPAVVRRFAADQSIFIDNDYLIKGVAGAIFWRLVNDYVAQQRTGFSNRELRSDPTLRLPDITDNLEARLILLQRRLAERCPFLRIEKTGRGRFRLNVTRPIRLTEAPPGAAR